MKILHINTSDTGGAATACRRIHLGLLKRGIDSKILLLYKKQNVPNTFQFKRAFKPEPLLTRVFRKILRIKKKQPVVVDFRSIDKHTEYFTFPTTPYDITESDLYREADIIQINWASGFLNEKTFFATNKKPVVWRMPDLYPCGGGYHYEKGFPFESFKDLIRVNYEIRRKSVGGKNIFFVPISKWSEQKSNESDLIKNFPKKMIHNGVDLNVFKSHDKLFSRKVFGLPSDKIILMFGCEDISNKRKGLEILFDTLQLLDRSTIQLVTFGRDPNWANVNYISVGEINDERLLSVLYAAADYFIMPSVEEAFGQVTIEALASGTPVISFPNGGSLDIIKDGVNGVLAKGFEKEDLKEAIERALASHFSQEYILEDVRLRFNMDDKIDEYIKVYESMLNA